MGEVIHVISSAGLYGAERTILGLIKSVTSYEHRVVCFGKRDGSQNTFVDALQQRNIPVSILADGYGDLRSNARNIGSLVKHADALSIHAHGYKGTLTASYARRLFPDARVVCTQHGFTNKSFKTRAFTKLETRLMKSRAIDHVFCASNAIKDYYISAGIRPSKLSYIANSVEIPPKSSIDLDRTSRDIDLLYLGRLSPEKGPDVLIDALGRLKARGTTVKTVIAGDGPLLGEIRERAEASDLRDSIEFPGFVSNPQDLLRRAKWLVMPSRTEGLPMSALEAMSLGTPLIASAVGELPTLVQNKVNGLLTQPGNADELAAAIDHGSKQAAETWKQAAESAYDTVAKDYALERYGREIAAKYDQVFAVNSLPANKFTELKTVADQ